MDLQAVRSAHSGKGKILQLFNFLSGAAACCNSASAIVLTFEKDALLSHLLELLAAKSRGLGLDFAVRTASSSYDETLITRLLAVAKSPSTDSTRSAFEPGACALLGHGQHSQLE